MRPQSQPEVLLAPPPPRWVLRTMNHLTRRLLASPLGKRVQGVMLLEFEGRRTGRTIKVPVNMHLVDGVVTAFTEARWRHNFEGCAPVTLTYRGQVHLTHGTLVHVSQQEMGAAVRKSLDTGGSALRTGIRSPKGHDPTVAELTALGPALGTSLIRFGLGKPDVEPADGLDSASRSD